MSPWLNTINASNLINSAGNETVNVFVGSKDLREGCAEGRGSLDCWETHLPDVITVAKTKDSLGLVHRDTLLYLQHLTVEDWLTAGGCVCVCKVVLIHVLVILYNSYVVIISLL